jgi:hypothetical protein
MMHFEAALVVLADARMRVSTIKSGPRIPPQLFTAMKTVNILNG